MACLGDYPTRIQDPDPDVLGRAEKTVAEALAKGAGKAWSEEDAERASGLLSTVEALDGARRVRLRRRGRARAARAEAGPVRRPRRGLRSRDDPRLQHLLAAGDRYRGADPGPRARRRDAFLQPADADEAGRGGGDRRLLPGGARGDDRGRRTDAADADPRQGQPRLHRQPPRPALLARVAADARRRGRRRGDDRPGLPPRRRLPDGPVRADRPDRARRQPQRRPLLLRAGRATRAMASEPDPGRDGRGRPARAQERRGLLQLRRRPPPPRRPRARTLGPDPRPRATWRASTRRRPRSSPASSPRSPTRPPSPSKRRSAPPPT